MKNKKVICLMGKARHGKDEAASTIKEYYEAKGKTCKLISFAGLLKEQALACGWDGKKDEAGRSFLQEFSAPVKKYWNKKAELEPEKYGMFGKDCYYPAKSYLEILDNDADIYIITDMRFKYEAEFFKQREDLESIMVRVLRPNFNSPLSIEQQNHISEVDLDDFKEDFLILNDSTLFDYKNKVIDFIEKNITTE